MEIDDNYLHSFTQSRKEENVTLCIAKGYKGCHMFNKFKSKDKNKLNLNLIDDIENSRLIKIEDTLSLGIYENELFPDQIFHILIKSFYIDQNYIVLIKNVTKLIHEKKDKTKKKLKCKLLARIAHEFKAPIMYIQNIIEEMKNDIITEKIKYLTEILLYLTFDLCESNISDITEPVDIKSNINLLSIKEYIEKFTKTLLLIYSKHINIEVMIDDILTNTKITINEKKFKQILINIISNSIKFTVEGTIKIIFQADYINIINTPNTNRIINIRRKSIIHQNNKYNSSNNIIGDCHMIQENQWNGFTITITDSGQGVHSEVLDYINGIRKKDKKLNVSGIGLILKLCSQLEIKTYAENVYPRGLSVRLKLNSDYLEVESARTAIKLFFLFNPNKFTGSSDNHYSSSDESFNTYGIKIAEQHNNIRLKEFSNKSLKKFSIINKYTDISTKNKSTNISTNIIQSLNLNSSNENIKPNSIIKEINSEYIHSSNSNKKKISFNNLRKANYLRFQSPNRKIDGSIITQDKNTIALEESILSDISYNNNKQFKILIVDDNKNNRDTIQRLIERYYKLRKNNDLLQIKQLNDGIELIYEVYTEIEQSGNTISQIIFCDEMMNYLNGSDAFVILQKMFTLKNTKPICFVSCSAFNDELYHLRMKSLKIDRVYEKPLSYGNIEYILNELLK